MMSLSLGVMRRGGEMPPLTLDFKRTTLDSRISFARASLATDVISGVLTTFAADAPRLSPQNGLLIEEPRTNSVRNAQASGAVVGLVGSGGSLPTNWQINNAGSMATEVVGMGTSNGFSYVRLRIYGTATTASYRLGFEYNSQTQALSGQMWTGSFYARQAAGSLNGVTASQARLRENDSAGVELGASTNDFTLGASFVRGTVTRTLLNASTARVSAELRLTFTSGQAIDSTLDIAAPQLELGAFATSYIPTSGSVATRAADLCSMPVGAWFNAAQGCLFVEAKTGEGVDPNASVSPRFARLENQAVTDFHEIRLQASDMTVRGSTQTASQIQAALAGGIWAAKTSTSACYAWRQDDMALGFASTTQSDSSSPQGMPAALSVLRLGALSVSSGFLNGWLKTVRYWPKRLPDSQLKAISP